MDFRPRAGTEVARDLAARWSPSGWWPPGSGSGAWSGVSWSRRWSGRWDLGPHAVPGRASPGTGPSSASCSPTPGAWPGPGSSACWRSTATTSSWATARRSLDLYYQAFRLPEFVMGAQLNAMSAVLFPMYSRIRSEGQCRAAARRCTRRCGIVGLFSIPVGVALALVARDAITVMFGTGGTDRRAAPWRSSRSPAAVTGLGLRHR